MMQLGRRPTHWRRGFAELMARAEQAERSLAVALRSSESAERVLAEVTELLGNPRGDTCIGTLRASIAGLRWDARRQRERAEQADRQVAEAERLREGMALEMEQLRAIALAAGRRADNDAEAHQRDGPPPIAVVERYLPTSVAT